MLAAMDSRGRNSGWSVGGVLLAVFAGKRGSGQFLLNVFGIFSRACIISACNATITCDDYLFYCWQFTHMTMLLMLMAMLLFTNLWHELSPFNQHSRTLSGFSHFICIMNSSFLRKLINFIVNRILKTILFKFYSLNIMRALATNIR